MKKGKFEPVKIRRYIGGEELVVWPKCVNFLSKLKPHKNALKKKIAEQDIKITNVNGREQFICLKTRGLNDGFIVAYDGGDFIIGYKGESVRIPVYASSEYINKANKVLANV